MPRNARIAVIILSVLASGLAGLWWFQWRSPPLPSYIASANGRVEMTRLDIAVKYPGRVVDLPFHEGDRVAAGAVLARQDTAELEAQIAAAEAQRGRASGAVSRAGAELEARRSAERLARLELDQAEAMRRQLLISEVELQRRRIALAGESAAAAAAASAVGEARAAVAETEAQIARLKIVRDEAVIRAPVGGRVEYRIVERDAVLPAGGRVASLLDVEDVYMTIFLPSEAAGRLRIGDEARIALDSFAEPVLPARVTFVSPEAQFTPKYVETASEREKLVYRVKLSLAADLARRHDGALKAGMTGDAYLRLDPAKPWPAGLAGRAP